MLVFSILEAGELYDYNSLLEDHYQIDYRRKEVVIEIANEMDDYDCSKSSQLKTMIVNLKENFQYDLMNMNLQVIIKVQNGNHHYLVNKEAKSYFQFYY